MHILLDAMTRLMAPILCFTAEEIWSHMPVASSKAESVHMAMLPEMNTQFSDDGLAQNWQVIIAVRGEVTKALENARASKMIGHPLDAAVTVSADQEHYHQLAPYAEQLRTIFIVSESNLVCDQRLDGAYVSEEIDHLQILVEPATGDKCERCWVHDPSVGTIAERPTICQRCKDHLDNWESVA
jgi:isoleucyl-tRNA synthetase